MWLPGVKELVPVVWRIKWPQEVRDRIIMFDNPDGNITNSNLEMVAKVLGWLVLKALVVNTRWAHVGVCSDNVVMVAW